MGNLNISIFRDYMENNLILSTSKFTGLSFQTQLPGGFADCAFTLPSMYFDPDEWRSLLIGGFLLLSDPYGSTVYEGFIEGLNDSEEGLVVQVFGPYMKASLQTAYLAYPTPPINTVTVIKELASKVPEWKQVYSMIWSLDYGAALEYLYEVKVQDAIEDALKRYTDDTWQPQFAVYDNLRPILFNSLYNWYKVSKHDMTLKYGSSLSLSDTYNKIQVIYEVRGKKEVYWAEDSDSMWKYGTREGSLSIGTPISDNTLSDQSVAESALGIAKIAGELALKKYSKPATVETLTLSGQMREYLTDNPVPVYWLRAGQVLVASDLPANPDSRFAFSLNQEQASYLIKRTSYSHEDSTMTVEIGDPSMSYEQYLEGMDISGGDVK